jgi:ADP-ribose pyrophosphatase YjhB (NUDIX family)
MEIKSKLTNSSGQELEVIYYEGLDPYKDLNGKLFTGVHAFCFCNGKFVIVFNNEKKYWTPPGGAIEPGETYEQAVIREVQEETNMKVLRQELIGFQDIYEPNRTVRQTRSFCIVEPYGDFISDPDEDITEIKLIDPKDYKQYFDWLKIGDRIMGRAIYLNNKFANEKETE